MNLLFFIALLVGLSGCYAQTGRPVKDDAQGWIEHADRACARQDYDAAQTFLLRAWELDPKSAETRLDHELCPKQGLDDDENL